ncbi:hypothetical protein [Alcaligenes sp. SDU_A2]|uniref:hypothetical protein n=1 Tax=Alcaligenes sp. SDU_A2 TaxID=3136634 RepID=UPI0031205353
MPNFQTDAHGLLCGQSSYADKGFGDVIVRPPSEVPAGQVLRWASSVDINAVEYGDPGTGVWERVDDHRQTSLYTSDGLYTVGSEHKGQTYNGLGPVPAWLSVEAPPVAEPTLVQLQAMQLAQINAAFEQAAIELTSGYPEAERLTWPEQRTEALAWAADPTAPTPYLDGLAAARGISAQDMRQKTLDQARLFLQSSQQLVGTRQRLRDQVQVALTAQAVKAVVWPVSGGEA